VHPANLTSDLETATSEHAFSSAVILKVRVIKYLFGATPSGEVNAIIKHQRHLRRFQRGGRTICSVGLMIVLISAGCYFNALALPSFASAKKDSAGASVNKAATATAANSSSSSMPNPLASTTPANASTVNTATATAAATAAIATAAIATAAIATATAARQVRASELGASLAKTAQKVLAELNKPDAAPTVRDLGNTALFLCLTQGDKATIEQLLRTEFGAQIMDQSSSAFGQLPWQIKSTQITDLNAMEFGCQPLGPILTGYGTNLSPEFKKWLRPHIDAALIAMRKHKVPVTYTNIYLMKAVDFILLGAAIDDQSTLWEGVDLLDKWIAYTKQGGIHEFDSPTYYACDLNSLLMGYLFSPDKVTASKFRVVLDYFWQDIAANYFSPTETMSGAHSRDYDFLRGSGGVDVFTYLAGLKETSPLEKVDMEKVYALLNETTPQGYHAGVRFLELSKMVPREVLSRWDDYPTKDRVNFICQDFSLSSANGGSYGPQDKLIAMQFASKKILPTVSIVADRFNSPYGKVKSRDKSGHEKPRHELLSPTVVQSKGTILALLDVDASQMKNVDSFSTNLILPAEADALFCDGARYEAKLLADCDITAHPCIGVLDGQTGLVLRIFHADAWGGSKAKIVLTTDADGLKQGACRVAIRHKPDARESLPDQHLKVGVLMVAKHCASDKEFHDFLDKISEAPIDEAFDEKTWKVKAKTGDLILEAGRDLSQRQDLYRKVNGIDALAPIFSVNGALLGPSLWNSEDVLLQKQ
jgi:hypothetical protein